jgi:DNA (cytosine-5)-methyltransferase 1
MTQENQRRVKYLFRKDVHDLPNRLRPPCHRDKDHSYVSMYGRMHWDKPAQTITGGFGSMGQGRFVHPTRPRTLTAHEAARLQGFPDFFDFSSVKGVTALREMIGNAVPPQLTALLVSQLLEEGHL